MRESRFRLERIQGAQGDAFSLSEKTTFRVPLFTIHFLRRQHLYFNIFLLKFLGFYCFYYFFYCFSQSKCFDSTFSLSKVAFSLTAYHYFFPVFSTVLAITFIYQIYHEILSSFLPNNINN